MRQSGRCHAAPHSWPPRPFCHTSAAFQPETTCLTSVETLIHFQFPHICPVIPQSIIFASPSTYRCGQNISLRLIASANGFRIACLLYGKKSDARSKYAPQAAFRQLTRSGKEPSSTEQSFTRWPRNPGDPLLGLAPALEHDHAKFTPQHSFGLRLLRFDHPRHGSPW
jgi:hypothetical protein